MDLKIKDVAELLNVSEKTIRRWFAEGKIPAYRLNHQIRFSRIEIQNWVMSCKIAKKEQKIHLNEEEAHRLLSNQIGSQTYSLFRAIYKGGVIHGAEGNTKEEVIRYSVKIIADQLGLDAEGLTDLLLDREKLMPTALNHGVGVPHTRDFLLQTPFDVITVVYPQKPIEYGALDGKKVNLLLFLFASRDKMHLHLLAKIAHLIQNEEAIAFLQKQPEKSALLDFIKQWESTVVP